MMGSGHATTGAAMWAGACVAATPLLGTDLLAPVVATAPLAALIIVGAAPVAGASLIPDIDHTNGTIANSMGTPTKILTKAVSLLSGGHRQATHGIWFWILVTMFAFSMHFAAVNAPAKPVDGSLLGTVVHLVVSHADWLTFFMLTAFGQRALGAKWLKKLMSRVWRGSTGVMVRMVFFLEAGIITAVAAVVWPEPEQWIWLPFAVSIGHLSHLIADTLTTAGVMWGWPSQKVTRFAIIGNAGSGREAIWSAGMGVLFMLALGASLAF